MQWSRPLCVVGGIVYFDLRCPRTRSHRYRYCCTRNEFVAETRLCVAASATTSKVTLQLHLCEHCGVVGAPIEAGTRSRNKRTFKAQHLPKAKRSVPRPSFPAG